MKQDLIDICAPNYAEALRQLCSRRETARQGNSVSNEGVSDLRAFGRELHAKGGEKLMAATYDVAWERYGARAVYGTAAAWTGIGTWAA